MALAKARETEKMAERVERHGSSAFARFG